MKKQLLKVMPVYSWVMLTIIVFFNFLTYFGTRLFTTRLKHYSIASSLDVRLPFVPFFILFYILAYAQWIIGFIVIGRDNRKICLCIFFGELIAKLIALLCFIFFPTTMEGLRPSMESLKGCGIWSELTEWIYTLDAPDNLFPSIHCLESWVCFRGALRLEEVPKWYVYVMLVMTLLVFASTVLVKQHVLVDIAGGVAAVETGLFISDRFLPKILKEEREKA